MEVDGDMKRFLSTKRLFKTVLLCSLLLFAAALPAQAADITMYIGSSTMWVDGYGVALDAAPYIKDGRTMVPLRAIAEAFGADVSAYGTESGLQARIEYRNVDLFLTVGDQGAHFVNEYGNDTAVHMDVAPEIRNSRMFVPLRFIAEGFGATVDWNSYTKTISISDGSQSGPDVSQELSDPATYLPFPDMELHYFRNYADGSQGYSTIFTRQPLYGSSYILDTAEIADEYIGYEEFNTHYLDMSDGIYEYYATSIDNESLMPWLKNNLYVGKTWSYDGDYGSIYYTVTGIDETIRVLNMDFENCLVVDVDNQAVGWSFRRYYAPHLGLVYEESPPGGYMTAYLESWRTN